MKTTNQTQPPAAGEAAHTPTPFDLFYQYPSPCGALNLAVSDAIHGKMPGEFVSELMAARDAYKLMATALCEARPYVNGSALANAQAGWATRSGAVLHMIDRALASAGVNAQ